MSGAEGLIRTGLPQDRQALEALYDICFPGEADFRRWFFDTLWKPHRTLLWEQDGQIPSAMQALEGNLMLDGKPYPVSYVWAAGTHPDFRGHGLMGRLLERSFTDGLERGEAFSTLITENDSLFAFYRPFGYTTIARVARRSLVPGALPPGCRVRPAEKSDREAVLALYRDGTREIAAMERGGAHFDHMLALYGENHVVMEDEKGTVKAYAFLDKREGVLFISEAMGEDALPRYLAERYDCRAYQCPVGPAEERTAPIGCIKALTPQAGMLLERHALPPYLNILLN